VRKVARHAQDTRYAHRTKVSRKTVRLDGQAFMNTDFVNCTFIYSGVGGVSFVGCKFARPRFVFDGPAANTMKFVRAMYHGGAADLIERTFEEIRENAPISITYN
jgi:hypothetical protein